VTEKLVIISWLVIHFQQGGSPFNLMARQPGSPWVQITSKQIANQNCCKQHARAQNGPDTS